MRAWVSLSRAPRAEIRNVSNCPPSAIIVRPRRVEVQYVPLRELWGRGRHFPTPHPTPSPVTRRLARRRRPTPLVQIARKSQPPPGLNADPEAPDRSHAGPRVRTPARRRPSPNACTASPVPRRTTRRRTAAGWRHLYQHRVFLWTTLLVSERRDDAAAGGVGRVASNAGPGSIATRSPSGVRPAVPFRVRQREPPRRREQSQPDAPGHRLRRVGSRTDASLEQVELDVARGALGDPERHRRKVHDARVRSPSHVRIRRRVRQLVLCAHASHSRGGGVRAGDALGDALHLRTALLGQSPTPTPRARRPSGRSIPRGRPCPERLERRRFHLDGPSTPQVEFASTRAFGVVHPRGEVRDMSTAVPFLRATAAANAAAGSMSNTEPSAYASSSSSMIALSPRLITSRRAARDARSGRIGAGMRPGRVARRWLRLVRALDFGTAVGVPDPNFVAPGWRCERA